MPFVKVEDLKVPAMVGEHYLVLTFVYFRKDGTRLIAPLINHPHNDIENGQKDAHYHVDTRFIDYSRNAHDRDNWFEEIRIYPNQYPPHLFHIDFYYLPMFNERVREITNVVLIKNSTLKHKCIYKGKCPHRGYDLSNAMPVDGVIKCPLHGLLFDADSKQVLNFI